MTATRLRYIADINPSIPVSVRNANEQYRSFVSMDAIGEDWTLDLTQQRPVSELLAGYSYFEDGDLVFAKVTPCFENGKAAVMHGLTQGAGFGTTEVTVVRPSKGVNARYLFYVLVEDRFRQAGMAEMTGAGGLKRVPDRVVRDYVVDVPPRHQQDAIVAHLDRETHAIDAFIADQEALIRLMLERRDASWQRAVEGLRGRQVPLRRVVKSIVDGPFGSSLTSAHYSDGGARVVRLGNIGVNKFKNSDRVFIPMSYFRDLETHSVVAGDVVVAGLGDDRMPLGRAAVVPDIGPAIVKADCFRVRPNKTATSEYLAWILSAPQTRARFSILSRGSTRLRLNTHTVKDVLIPLPNLADQREVVAEVDAVASELDAAVEECREAIAISRERRSAIISAGIKGMPVSVA